MFTWRLADVYLTLPDPLTIIWPSPDPYLTLISSFKVKKSCGGGVGNGVGAGAGGGRPTRYKLFLRV